MRATLPYLWIAMAKRKYTNADFIKAGINRHTVHKYSAKLPEELRKYQKLVKKIKENRLR